MEDKEMEVKKKKRATKPRRIALRIKKLPVGLLNKE